MKRGGFRRGSALLIVLGMMTVIVVSAVAFSAYMRYSRVPSSFLRRTSSSRLLAKAALAEAIERIDCAIGNNPHPGIMQTQYAYPRTGGTQIENHWEDRVFIGGTNSSQTASIDHTVSVLNVEALAYLPPPLINDVRFWSRRSLAALWEPMGFDAGRYAFCAVDVSDYIDINRVRCANSDSSGQPIYGRTSADNGRISLAYAFEDSNHTGYQTPDPTAWDSFMDQFIGSGKVPLVSLADYNLAVFANSWAEMSPFCNFFKNNALFVSSRTGDDADFLRHQVFVTDSLFPVTNAANDMVDLACETDQPFYGYEGADQDDEKKNDVRLETVAMGTSGGQNFWDRSGIQQAGDIQNAGEYIMLYDYLDKDSVPSSLAMPTMERTPMVCGVSLEGSVLTVSVEEGQKHTKYTADGAYAWVSRDYKLRVQGQLEVNVGTVYPFKYDHGRNLSYQVQAAATIAFVPSDLNQLRRENANSAFVVAKNDWKTSQQTAQTKTYGRDNLGKAIVMQSNLVNVPIKKATSGSSDAQDVIAADDLPLSFGTVNVDLTSALAETEEFEGSTCSFRVAQKYEVDKSGGAGDTGGVAGNTLGGLGNAVGNPIVQYGWLPANEKLTDSDSNLQDGTAVSGTYKPVIQLWVRIIDSNNETVDLVPAYVADDKDPIDVGFANDAKISNIQPLVRFYDKDQTKGTITYTAGDFDSIKMDADEQDIEIYPKSYLADDPRFNYGPENLVAMSTASSTLGDEWLQNQTSGSHDGDIFMATSDAGYLQSKHEFANILRISKITGGLKNSGAGDDGGMRTGFGSSPAKDAMWNCYSTGWNGTDDLKNLKIYSGTSGFRINPYTPSTEVMMFALANTPLDWWAASTNYVNDTVKEQMMGDQTEANKYAFSQMPGATINMTHGKLDQDGNAPDDCLLKLAEKMKNSFRSSNDWEQEYRNLGWTTADEIAGVDLGVNLHSVDRKYLYGYWRECLEARQQLFLVFIRAEPMMMGAGTSSASPPQLGARAVALVWRDPTPTKESVGSTDSNWSGNFQGSGGGSQPQPHRTRILFYRQFD